MRALWIVPSFPSELNPVAGIFHETQALALSRAGIELDIVAPVPRVPPFFAWLSSRWRRYRDTPVKYHVEELRVYRPRYTTWPKEYLVGMPHWFISRAIDHLHLAKPDVIHAHFAYPGGLVGAYLSRKYGAPMVLTLHGSDVNAFPYTNARNKQRFISALKSARICVSVSPELAEKARDLSGRLPRHLPLGIDLARFDIVLSKRQARRNLNISENVFVILYVGNIIQQKGILELLSAVSSLEQAYLAVFVGDGPLRPSITAARSCLAVGAIKNTEVVQYMRAADVLVLPSYSEGLPTVLVEAGAIGLPIIATAVGGIKTLLADERGYLIDSPAPFSIKQALMDVMRAPQEALTRAARLRAYVHKYYGADGNAKALIGFYQEVLQYPSTAEGGASQEAEEQPLS